MKSHHTGRHLPSDSDSSLHSKCFLSHKSSGLHTAREHLETAFPATSCLHGVPGAAKERPQVAPCAHRDTTHSPVPELVCPFLSPLSHVFPLQEFVWFHSKCHKARKAVQCLSSTKPVTLATASKAFPASLTSFSPGFAGIGVTWVTAPSAKYAVSTSPGKGKDEHKS